MIAEAQTKVGGASVSRETFAALKSFEALVRHWNTAINLVSKGSLSDLWTRHIEDSAQLFSLAPESATSWVDLGSGGGFPGLVVAILALEAKPELIVTLVESDQRKSAFLRHAVQTLHLSATIVSERIDAIAPLQADVLSARALAPLSTLLGFADRHCRRGGVAVFPKGASFVNELKEAQGAWTFDLETKSSSSHSEAAILLIRNINRAK